MAIRRYTAIADTTITNAYKSNLTTRGDDSNMGRSDVLEIFSIYAQASTTSAEQARVLIKFSDETIDELETFKDNIEFKVLLKVFNAPHSLTLPSGFEIEIARIIKAWTEGNGLDMEEYSDTGAIKVSEDPEIYNGRGATWNVAKNGDDWNILGGDYDLDSIKTFIFDEGYEELEIDITDFIVYWIANPNTNHGIIIKLADSEETSDTTLYTKRFFARGTEYFYEKPLLEARWEDAEIDDRANFYIKSNLRSLEDNTNIILLKNYISGALKNIPDPLGATSAGILADNSDDEQLKLKFYESKGKATDLGATVTLTNLTTGIYKAEVILDTTVGNVYASWQSCDDVYNNLVLHFNADSTTTPVDASLNNLVSTYVGDTSIQEYYPTHFTDQPTSVYFDGTLASPDSVEIIYPAELALSGQFTVDFWVRFGDKLGTSIGAPANKQYLFAPAPAPGSPSTSLALYWENTTQNAEQFVIEVGSASFAPFALIASTQTLDDSQWYHIAITRNTSGEVNFYFNGEPGSPVIITGLDTLAIDWDNKLRIGRSGEAFGTYPFKGHIKEFRVTKELLYNADFTSLFPTKPPGEYVKGCTIYHEEYIKVKTREAGSEKPPTYITAIQNFKNSYSKDESARFRMFTRLKDWSPTIYTIATKELRPEIVEKAYYRIVRVVDDFVVIGYGTETPAYTKLSYDKDGSYFDLDMSLFEPGWAYRIEFMYNINGELRQQPETFKFRVE